MSGQWRVLVRDADRRIIGEISAEHSMEIVDRHQALGSWTLTVEGGGRDARLLAAGSGIVLIRNGDIAFSGPTRLVERVLNADEGGYGTLTASGPCDLAWLHRLVWPGSGEIPQTGRTFPTDSYRLGEDRAETVLLALIRDQAGANAVAARRVAGLVTAPDQRRGENVAVASRFGLLLEVLFDTAARGRVGVDLRQRDDGQLGLSIYPERDQAAAARFSIELGNLRSYQYTINPPEATYVIVADEQEKQNRVFYGFDRPDGNWPGLRIEEFLDGTDLAAEPADKARKAANARLNEARGMAGVTFEPIDTEAVVLGRDYGKGDTVTVEIDGRDYTDVVREIRYIRTPDEGQVIMPVIGQDEQSPRIYRHLTRLQRKVHSRETRR